VREREGEGGRVVEFRVFFKDSRGEEPNVFPLAWPLLTFELGARSKSAFFERVIVVKFGFRMRMYSVTFVRPQAFRPGGESEGEFLVYLYEKPNFFGLTPSALGRFRILLTWGSAQKVSFLSKWFW